MPLFSQVSSATCACPGVMMIMACICADCRADAIRSAVSMQMPDRLWITASGVSTRCEPPKEYGPML